MYSIFTNPQHLSCFFTFHLYNRGGCRLHVGFPRASSIRFSPPPDRVTHLGGGRSHQEERCLRRGLGLPPSPTCPTPSPPLPSWLQLLAEALLAEALAGMLLSSAAPSPRSSRLTVPGPRSGRLPAPSLQCLFNPLRLLALQIF